MGAYERHVPDPGTIYHTADLNQDSTIGMSELLRVIQFFNSTSLHCEAGSEDGFAPGPGGTGCTAHCSDYNPQDWQINLSELLRLIQFYTMEGCYPCPTADPPTEDGYCVVSP